MIYFLRFFLYLVLFIFLFIENNYAQNYQNIIINEIYADPEGDAEPSPRMIPNAEYIELYNVTNQPISLNGFLLSGGKIGNGILPAQSYVILCPTSSVAAFSKLGFTIGVTSWNSLTNNGEKITVTSPTGKLIDSVTYSLSFYHDQEKQDGGWSMECIDPISPCKLGSMNWKASDDAIGGTPGKKNSVYNIIPDHTPPELNKMQLINSKQINLFFNEKLDVDIPKYASFIISPEVKIDSFRLSKDESSIFIFFNQPLEYKINYYLTVQSIRDCSGNLIGEKNKISFRRPEPADSFDIVINEILFNPIIGGVDFVEIYNRSDKYINLNNWQIASLRSDGKIESSSIFNYDYVLAPSSFLVLTSDSEILKNQYPKSNQEVLLSIKNFPSYNDDEGTVILMNDANQIIDQFTYQEDFHFSLLKNKEGISLEKISPSLISNQKESWHSASSEVGYATPGYRNSQFFETKLHDEIITIEPAVFTPDQDGYTDFTTISYHLPQPGYIGNCWIVNIEGIKIKQLISNSLLSTNGLIQWDGTDEQGQKIPVGYYIVFSEFFDLTGNVIRNKKVVVVGTRM